MAKDIRHYLHYYLGQQCTHDEETGIITAKLIEYVLSGRMSNVKPILRKLSSMTEEELLSLIMLAVPKHQKDAPTPEDYDLEIFRNDGGNMVDGNVEIGAQYSCGCYVGQITVTDCGTIHFYDEEKDVFVVYYNAPELYHYLLSKGFDLFGLIESDLALDQQTLNK